MNRASIRHLARRTALVLGVLSCMLLPLPGQQTLTLHEALEKARESHLYQAHLQRVEALRGHLVQAGRRPNPSLGSELATGAAFGDGGDNEISIEFSQPWERGGKRRIREQIAGVGVRQAELEAEDYLRTLSADIRLDYLQLTRARRELALLNAHRTRLEKLRTFDQLRVDQGEIPSINLEFLGGELAGLTARVNHLEMEERRVRYHLDTFLATPLDPERVVPAPEWGDAPIPPSEELIRLALERRPDLERMRTHLVLAEHQIEAEKIRGNSDWEWGLGYAFGRDAHDPDEIEPRGVLDSITSRSHLLEFKIRIPLRLWDDNAGNLSAALATHKSIESELAHQEAVVRNEVLSAYFLFQHSRAETSRYREEVVPSLENSLQRIEAAYQLTGDDLLSWLGLQRDFWNAVAEGIDADYTLWRSVIELEEAVGAPLGPTGPDAPSTQAMGSLR